jgi:hypothetical protein
MQNHLEDSTGIPPATLPGRLNYSAEIQAIISSGANEAHTVLATNFMMAEGLRVLCATADPLVIELAISRMSKSRLANPKRMQWRSWRAHVLRWRSH